VFFFCCYNRTKMDCHAVTHTQVFGPKMTYFYENVLLLCGPISMLAYSGSLRTNMRRLINETREIAQYEFRFRGPYEHQSVHHVRGAELEHDECAMVMSARGFFRLNDRDPHKWYHKYQSCEWYKRAVETYAGLVPMFVLPLIRLDMVKLYLAENEYEYALASFLGTFNVYKVVHLFWMPLTHGVGGYIFWALCIAINTMIMNNIIGVFFFAQHVWDRHTDEATARMDWGRYNTWSSFSLWNNWGNWKNWHPFFWGNEQGSCAATLTYHLEHTMFPGCNYMQLPLIAPVIERVATKWNIEYPKLVGVSACLAKYHEYLLKYGKDPAKEDFKLTRLRKSRA